MIKLTTKNNNIDINERQGNVNLVAPSSGGGRGKQDKITAIGILKGEGEGVIVPAVPGEDYLVEHQSLEGYATEEYVDNALENAQGKTITDTDGYFTTDTVEGALSELGKEVIKREWYKLEYWIFNWYIANDASSGCRTIDFDAASALTGAPLALICLFLTNLQTWDKDRMKTDFLADVVPAIEALKAANLITYPSAYDWKFALYVKPDEYGVFEKRNTDYFIRLKNSSFPGATLYAYIDIATGEYTDFYVSTDNLPISFPELKISDSKYANIVKNLKLDEKQDKLELENATALTVDTQVRQDSNNLVTSGAVYAAIGNIEAALAELNDRLESLM